VDSWEQSKQEALPSILNIDTNRNYQKKGKKKNYHIAYIKRRSILLAVDQSDAQLQQKREASQVMQSLSLLLCPQKASLLPLHLPLLRPYKTLAKPSESARAEA